MTFRISKSTACEELPMEFQYSTQFPVEIRGQEKLYWYVITDEHMPTINKFCTEQEAINFINECEMKETGIIACFHGNEVYLNRIEKLCVKE